LAFVVVVLCEFCCVNYLLSGEWEERGNISDTTGFVLLFTGKYEVQSPTTRE